MDGYETVDCCEAEIGVKPKINQFMSTANVQCVCFNSFWLAFSCLLPYEFYTVFRKKHPLMFPFISRWTVFRFL